MKKRTSTSVKAFCFLLSLILVLSLITIPSFAASPNLSTLVKSNKVTCYSIKATKTTTYSDSACSKETGFFRDNEEVILLEVTGSYCKVSYPKDGGGRKTAYAHISDLLLNVNPSDTRTASGKITTYRRDNTSVSYGYVAKGDSVIILKARGSFTQIVYPVPSGYKAAFILTTDANKYLKTSANTGTGKGSGIITNKSYNISVKDKAKENQPHYENRSGSRNANAYNTVINQFNVTSNGRYSRTSKSTYCNIFAWDVMSAMGVDLPHWVKNNAPSKSYTKGAKELTANMLYNWLNNYGSRYGWYTVNARNAQNRANKGFPTIAIWYNKSGGSGHVAVVRPETSDYKYIAAKGPIIAQAGGSNYNYATVSKGFNRTSGVIYWTHD